VNLQPISSLKPSFIFTCLCCGRRTVADENSRADLDGKAFQAYYCGECATEQANTGRP
jgi:hypothetical protein